ncbi:adenylate/guanylate cyclase domain-containing protein [Microbacterium sp. ARD31]|uniref:CHASE2 domain-containing protein n=1 Tax=Microbacterium sp. ARD31 TaxID=2962576 RepID=UPI002881A146|nr:adenylate/guanylate cyclase domain-containing protein [Microbacterium sp. ARD31]MDT0182657.1 adenylate/guanylate cyclase domain-containing protein [Microbacterium sp. ARD31]
MLLSLGLTLAGAGGDWARRASDVLWPIGDADPRVVVVAIDAASQADAGDWPWSRSQQAALLSAIADERPLALGFDVIAGPGPDGDGTGELATTLARVPSVVATAFASAVRAERGVLVGSEPLAPDPLIAAAGLVGHTLVPADADGVTRTVPLVVQTPRGQHLPGFALALAAAASEARNGAAPPLLRPRAVQYRGLTVPVEHGALLRISWTDEIRSDARAVVAAADVLDGTVSDQLRGAIVLVGVADVTVGDTHVTPLQPGATTPGVLVQAQAVNTILHRSWVTPAPWWLTAVTILILGAVAAFAAWRLAPWAASGAVLALVAAWVLAAIAALPLTGIQLDLVRVPASVLACAAGGGIVRLASEQRDRRRAADLLSRYVPQGVARRLLDERGERALDQGIRMPVALLFCDLRAFTPMAESLDPDDVRHMLDAYYGYVCARVFAASGTVMQFVGDEVFATFGALQILDDPRATARACASALVADVGQLDAELSAAGLPPVRFGVGLHYGPVVAGTVGASGRRQYAVVGDAVNVGSRLCAAAAEGEIVASIEVWPSGAYEAEELEVKGKRAAILVRRVRAASSNVGAERLDAGHLDPTP